MFLSGSKTFWLAEVENVLAEHEMFEKLGGGETSKQGHAVETCHVRQTVLVSFARPLHAHVQYNPVLLVN